MISRSPVGFSKKHLEEAMQTTGEFPQHHLPVGSKELCKDNAKDKPEAMVITGFFAFMRRLFFPWEKPSAKVSLREKNHEFQS